MVKSPIRRTRAPRQGREDQGRRTVDFSSSSEQVTETDQRRAIRGAYAIPGPIGGKLIREVVTFLRTQHIPLPITSHILIATSAGSDSLALAHLLAHYGRRVGERHQITLLHINHGWRGKASDADARHVRARAKAWGVRCKVVRLKPFTRQKGVSWEDAAREARKAIYARLTVKGAVVLTAHQADDLAETLLWRLFTGATQTHGGGIAARHGAELRPLLRVRKKNLQAYLKEVGETWREDATNWEGRFLRSQMRLELLPIIEKLFPRAVDHLVKLALAAQQGALEPMKRLSASSGSAPVSPSEEMRAAAELSTLFRAAGLYARRGHWELIERCLRDPSWAGELHLPGDWRLKREWKSKKPKLERWVLEKN